MTLEETRVLSQLDDRVHYVIDLDGRKYTCYAGLVVPYSVGATVMLYVLTNSGAYHGKLETFMDKEEIKRLNRHDSKLLSPGVKIPFYLCSKMRTIMETWEPHHFDELVPTSWPDLGP
jgi:hypothetical protein